MKKKYLFILLIFFLVLIYIFFNFDFFEERKINVTNLNNSDKSEISEITSSNESEISEITNSSSSKMNDVTYSSLDLKGNEYIITAREAEADISNSNILYLTDVKAIIKLKNSNEIKIYSNYGKYNSINYNTIFSKNVIITYLYNKIISDYLDFSFERNSMIISKNVEYTNFESILKADVIEMNIKTKDTKIYMYENKKKVNINNKK